MEVGGDAHHLYGMSSMDLREVGERSQEWNLNEWKWDGDLFIASSVNSVPSNGMGKRFFPLTMVSSNSSSSCSEEGALEIEKGKRELEKRRRIVVVEEENLNDEEGTLSLKLGGHGHQVQDREVGNWEGVSGKKTKIAGATPHRQVCQVEDCGADLSKAKDYHRRHKVCEMHSKAAKALVGNVMQRFCQQCSRFHLLQEFDEGKRSCRRRLVGHNKRRRKTNPKTAVNGSSLNDDQTSGYLLISLLRILSSLHSNRSDQTTDQDLLTHLLRNLANQTTENGGKTVGGLLQEPCNLLKDATSVGNSEVVSAFLPNDHQLPPRPTKQYHAVSVSVSEMPGQGVPMHNTNGGSMRGTSSVKPNILNTPPAFSEVGVNASEQMKMNNFNLNDIYVDSDDGMEDPERSPVPTNLRTSSHDFPSWAQQDSHQSSPPHISRNSDSASPQSPSSSNGEAQSRTDRIVFKLFGKVPNDFPLVLRAQILDWLSHSPTDIESYIKPGCIVLTIYLHQVEAAWEELCYDLSSNLTRLLDVSNDTFWRTGWVCIRVQHQIAFIYDGQVVIDASLPIRSSTHSRILSVKPIAISASERAQFSVRGINLTRPSTRLFCALEGKYLIEESTRELINGVDGFKERDEQCLNFFCSIPDLVGRGFIEIEDQVLSSSFFPFIVAEEDVCSEICMLENVLECTEPDTEVGGVVKIDTRNQALDFIHEMGWLLHRSQLKSRLGDLDPNADRFTLKRFKWLMEFSMDHDWCAVVRKLLDILLDGTIGTGEHPSLGLALLEMGLLHRAVRRNSRLLVEVLLRYVPKKVSDKLESEDKMFNRDDSSLFRPDVLGPGGLTPLHIAAGKDDSEDVLDALTNDPRKVGVEAWKSARDSTGCTPEDYARLRGHYSYIHLVQRKMSKRSAPGHVVIDIPNVDNSSSTNQKQKESISSFEMGTPELRSGMRQCKRCDQKLACGLGSRSLLYRPAMLSMLAIGAVCVCVALLFKSSPEVLYVFQPFRWELLEYGTS